MTRSELARKCEVSIETLRYYEKRKLLSPPPRSKGGYRLYCEGDAVKIRFIKNAQKLGFTLTEIGDLFKLRVRQGAPCENVLLKARTRLEDVEKKIKDLQGMRRVLKELIKQCNKDAPTSDCPILASIETEVSFK